MSDTAFDSLNRVLYDLCATHPLHDDYGTVIAKVWLIGRAYAAAIERRRNVGGLDNDEFYKKVVAPQLCESELDAKLRAIRAHSSATEQNLPDLLDVHKYLVDLMERFTELEKRSLASKYLHFHFPSLFFIYDNRARTGLSRLEGELGTGGRPARINTAYDQEYQRFCYRALRLKSEIRKRYGVDLTLRQIDNLLVAPPV